MSLIEGIGDEVTVGFGILTLMCLVLLAWFSTHTRDIPFVSIIVVELSQRRRLSNRRRTEGGADGENTRLTEPSPAETSAPEREPEQTAENVVSASQSESRNITSNTVSGLESDLSSEQFVLEALKSKDESRRLSSAGDTSDVPSETVATDNAETAPNAVSAPTAFVDSAPSVEAACQSVCDSNGLCRGAGVGHSQRASNHSAGSSPDAESPDEVRKRRVAYFESSRKKECADSEGTGNEEIDITQDDSGACPAATESVGKLSGSGPKMADSHETGEVRLRDILSSDPSSAADVGESEDIGAGPSASTESSGETSSSQQIRVRLKYLNDTQRLVYASPQETIGNFRRTHFSAELEENKIIRFIFNGQDLRNDLWTLGSYNISDNSVIHCLITQNHQQQESSSNGHVFGENDLELGVFIFPIFGLILGVLWYFRFSYKQYFNAVSTVSLAGVSFIYCLALVSSLRGRQRQHHHLD